MRNKESKSQRKEMTGLTYAMGERQLEQQNSKWAAKLTYADAGLQPTVRQGPKHGLGAGGTCLCPECDEKVSHEQSIPCNSVKCPKCGHFMIREQWKS